MLYTVNYFLSWKYLAMTRCWQNLTARVGRHSLQTTKYSSKKGRGYVLLLIVLRLKASHYHKNLIYPKGPFSCLLADVFLPRMTCVSLIVLCTTVYVKTCNE